MFKIFHEHKIKCLGLVVVLLILVPILYASNSPTNSLPSRGDLEYKGAVLAHIHKFGHGYGSPPSKAMHIHLNSVGYNTVQLNTFAYMRSRKDTKVLMGHDPTMSEKHMKSEIQNLSDSGFNVMLKPHIWIGGHSFNPDNWRNKIDFSDADQRKKWFQSYEKFILSEAELAQATGVEIFVVGTELVGVSKYTKEWEKLIDRVRQVYKGKLTYAAEGMNASNIKFWGKLDYIGIDAYFPLSDKKNPSLDELISGWEKYKEQIESLSQKYNKKVIFTEIGYKSVEGTAIKPWEWNNEGKESQEEQALAFEATARVFGGNPYLAGLFVWKYFTDMDSYERDNIPKGFTPYDKKAETVISSWFNSQ